MDSPHYVLMGLFMYFAELISARINFFQTQTLIAIVIIGVLGILFYLKPKAMFKVVALILVSVAVLYILSLMGDVTTTGITQKREMVDKHP